MRYNTVRAYRYMSAEACAELRHSAKNTVLHTGPSTFGIVRHPGYSPLLFRTRSQWTLPTQESFLPYHLFLLCRQPLPRNVQGCCPGGLANPMSPPPPPAGPAVPPPMDPKSHQATHNGSTRWRLRSVRASVRRSACTRHAAPNVQADWCGRGARGRRPTYMPHMFRQSAIGLTVRSAPRRQSEWR
ncbi:hypothetical protein BV25DRAFT_407611 [Artomyces pyxidatus]|uniref:Uncharacterized protein n=1 Tax=Artomyces pyxidatus TaxID=48021 RepID=A0ACB8SEW0_9AGAM|nr:hypothetical protein BV25DRAFT_407611 [Artomyces pyxidatus]